MKNKLFYIFVIIIALASLFLIVSQRFDDKSDGRSVDSTKMTEVQIGKSVFFVELATTAEERQRGLSGRTGLEEDSGMLFIFDIPDFYLIWMKDMNFPIDVIWLDENYKIVDITENLAVESYPNPVTSKLKAQYILELKASSAQKYELKVGDVLTVRK